MSAFPLCPKCVRECADPETRRFHAQPIACPACGPRVTLLGAAEAAGPAAVGAAADHLRGGRIVALKGLGGFQLLARADRPEVVSRLRERKRRPTKPLAAMVSSAAIAARFAAIDPQKRRLLESPENPILLLPKRPGAEAVFAPVVAPGAALHPGLPVVLSGGCFGNAELLARVRRALEAPGRRVFSHGLVPPGDGGLAVSQLAVALAARHSGEKG